MKRIIIDLNEREFAEASAYANDVLHVSIASALTKILHEAYSKYGVSESNV